MTAGSFILATVLSLTLGAATLLAAGLVAHVAWLLLLAGWDAAA